MSTAQRTTIHVIEPVRNLTLSIGGQKIQVSTGRLDYYSQGGTAFVTVRHQDEAKDPLIPAAAPADAGRQVFGRRGTLRVMGYAAAATDPGEIDPGVMVWTQVCSCNAKRLKGELLALEPVLTDGDLQTMGLA